RLRSRAPGSPARKPPARCDALSRLSSTHPRCRGDRQGTRAVLEFTTLPEPGCRVAPGETDRPSGGRASVVAMRVDAVQLAAALDTALNRRAVSARLASLPTGLDLIVLPEASMCDFGPLEADLGGVAEPLDGPFVGLLAE